MTTPSGDVAYVEVKGPDWQSQIPQDERIAGRTREPKNKQAEARSFSTLEPIEHAILQASDQLPCDQPTLVVVVDDLFEPSTEFPVGVLSSSLDHFFQEDGPDNVGVVLFLTAELRVSSDHVEEKSRFFENRFASDAAISHDLKKALILVAETKDLQDP